MTSNTNVTGRRIVIARNHNKMTQKALASKLEITQPNLYYLESGRHNPSDEILEKIAIYLGVTSNWLKGETLEGGVPMQDEPQFEVSEKEKLSSRWVDVFKRLKSLGVISSDSDFAEQTGVGKTNLSLVLSGKSSAPVSWIPLLEQLGGNKDYIYSNKHPIVVLKRAKHVKDAEAVTDNIKALMRNIAEDTKLLQFYLSQVLY
jgi:transcriptional regulator with XRE-family HTH domain